MADIAILCRIFDSNPSDDLVTKRREGIDVLSKAWRRKTNVGEILRIATGVAAGLQDPLVFPAPLAADAITHLSKNSAALIHEGHELEVTVCSAAAALAWIEANTQAEDGHPFKNSACVSSALWSAMALQNPVANPRLEALRQEVVTTARTCVLDYGRVTRGRSVVPPFKIEVKEDESKDEDKLHKKLEAAAEASITALRENAIRDREEINMLWWAINDYSEILGRRLSQNSEITKAIVGAIEFSRLTRRLPSEAQKHLAIRHVTQTEPISFQALVAGLGGDRRAIAASISENPRIAEFPVIFPLLSAIASDEHKVDENKTLTLAEWTKHVVLEGCIALMNLEVRPGV